MSYETKMQRSKTGIRTASYQNPNRGCAPLPITVFELPAEFVPANPNLTSLVQAIAFEAVIRERQIQRQRKLEQDPKFQKPETFAEKTKQLNQWLNADTFETWSRLQKHLEEIEAVPNAA